jgi:uncharacterized membrane protein YedE/YeeE
MNIVLTFVVGLVFGVGLIVGGMANPSKVLGFLDLAGQWDPSLALVMAGAIAVGSAGFFWADARKTTLLGQPMRLPASRTIDWPLIGGSLVFGVGWGIAGICPGPGIVLLGAGIAKGTVFVVSMLAGMLIYELLPPATS